MAPRRGPVAGPGKAQHPAVPRALAPPDRGAPPRAPRGAPPPPPGPEEVTTPGGTTGEGSAGRGGLRRASEPHGPRRHHRPPPTPAPAATPAPVPAFPRTGEVLDSRRREWVPLRPGAVPGPGLGGGPEAAAAGPRIAAAANPNPILLEKHQLFGLQGLARAAEPRDYRVSVRNDVEAGRSVLSIHAQDSGVGLLADLADALSALGLDIAAASCRTDRASNVFRASFEVSKAGGPLPASEHRAVRALVLAACYTVRTQRGLAGAAVRRRGLRHRPGPGPPAEAAELATAALAFVEAERAGDAGATAGARARLAEAMERMEAAPAAGAAPRGGGEGAGGLRRLWGLGGGQARSLLMLNAAAMLFGSNQVLIKLAEQDVGTGTLNLARFGIASLVFLPRFLKARHNKRLVRASLELSFWLFAGYTTQAIGLVDTTASRSALTGEFTVLLVPFLAGLAGAKVQAKHWLAGVVALVGVGLVTNSGGSPNVGDAWCVASALFFAVHIFRTEKRSRDFLGHEDEQGLVAIQLVALAGFSALSEAGRLALDPPADLGAFFAALPGEVAAMPWPILFAMGLGTTALTLWLEVVALKDVSATLAAITYSAEPVWGALFAYQVLGDRFGTYGYLGAAMVVCSCLVAQVGGDGAEKADGKKEA